MKKITLLLVGLSSFALCAAQTAYTLPQLLDSARQNNITLHNAQAGVNAARQQRKEAFTKFFPSISGTGAWFNADKGMAKMDFNPGEMITPELAASLSAMFPPEALAALASPVSLSMMKNGTIAGINATQPLFAGGQIVNGNRLAKVGEDVAALQLQLTEDQVELTTQQYYWQIIALQEKLQTIASVEALLSDLHKDVDVAVRAGLALHNDLLQVQLRQNEVESQRLKVQNGLSLVKLLLAQYCGLSDTAFTLMPDLDPLPLPTMQDHAQALQATAEYQLLDKQVQAARLQQKMTIGENLPSLAVGAGYNYHNLMDNDRTFAMVYATLSVPITDWWGSSHAIRRKRIEYQKALDEQQDKSELLQIRMQNAWNNVVEARQQLDIAQRSIEQAEENLRLNRDYYRAGTIKMSDLLEAQLLYQQAHDRHTDACADYRNKILEYQQAVGQ
ncbi:MAG: TolC family protein [Bacteroidales bacterium]|nr:TolC family protein [Bacteroidales bacterium]